MQVKSSTYFNGFTNKLKTAIIRVNIRSMSVGRCSVTITYSSNACLWSTNSRVLCKSCHIVSNKMTYRRWKCHNIFLQYYLQWDILHRMKSFCYFLLVTDCSQITSCFCSPTLSKAVGINKLKSNKHFVWNQITDQQSEM